MSTPTVLLDNDLSRREEFLIIFGCSKASSREIYLEETIIMLSNYLKSYFGVVSERWCTFTDESPFVDDFCSNVFDPTVQQFNVTMKYLSATAHPLSVIRLVTIGDIIHEKENDSEYYGCETALIDQSFWFENAISCIRSEFGEQCEIHHYHFSISTSEKHFLRVPSAELGLTITIPCVSERLVLSSDYPPFVKHLDQFTMTVLPSILPFFYACQSSQYLKNPLLKSSEDFNNAFNFFISANEALIHPSQQETATQPVYILSRFKLHDFVFNSFLANTKRPPPEIVALLPESLPPRALPEALVDAVVTNPSALHSNASKLNSLANTAIQQPFPCGTWYPQHGGMWTNTSGELDFLNFTSQIPLDPQNPKSESVRVRLRGGYACSKSLSKIEKFPGIAHKNAAVEWALRKYLSLKKEKKQQKKLKASSFVTEQTDNPFFDEVAYELSFEDQQLRTVEEEVMSEEQWSLIRNDLIKAREAEVKGSSRVSVFYGGRTQDDIFRDFDAKLRRAWKDLELKNTWVVVDGMGLVTNEDDVPSFLKQKILKNSLNAKKELRNDASELANEFWGLVNREELRTTSVQKVKIPPGLGGEEARIYLERVGLDKGFLKVDSKEPSNEDSDVNEFSDFLDRFFSVNCSTIKEQLNTNYELS
eukprot:GDKJ01064735.1.p1 GENE.GDKJ01064735.1~~GDKJ01064735.1.p1  ORF type:complete len:649 (-),score=152.54 GDKJ01064735.1:49-1995(-)